MVLILRIFVRHILKVSVRLRESFLYREVDMIGERVLCVCFVLSVHCTFDGDGGSKLQSRSCLSCFFYHREQYAFFFSKVFHIISVIFF